MNSEVFQSRGDSSHIDLIFEANRDVMRSKNSLSVGQKLRIPPVPVNR
jgi:nucleoid-associated protein YgaU